MQAIEIARRLKELNEPQRACQAYTVAIHTGLAPEQELEAAAFLLRHGTDYRVSYTSFQKLYNQGLFMDEILPIMTELFYAPNEKLLRTRYERNCRLLARYPYFFREGFPEFEELPIKFFPFDEHNGYVPFYLDEERFGDYVNLRTPVVSRNFFADLSKPIFASDVYSQYELEYLNDNVRPSEDVGKENHLYLHYSDWMTFCAWLQVLNLRPLTASRKTVFLIEDEEELYPIDFAARYGIDYTQFNPQPIRIADVSRMIWHTQLSTHNGGDFFNEIFDSHPNLLCMPSIMFYNIEEEIEKMRETLGKVDSLRSAMDVFESWGKPRLVEELYHMREPSNKDLLVAMYLCQKDWNKSLDKASRICPALFFQPHFHNIVYDLNVDDESGDTMLYAENVEEINKSNLFRKFKYIKTFTPMRRFTTSHGATVKFMYNSAVEDERKKKEDAEAGKEVSKKIGIVSDAISERVFNRSFMVDQWDRLYRDSVLVRFEDGKLNPTATFTALAAFLDLPYTESMTYCSEKGERDPVSYAGNVTGFDPSTIYRTYDEYVNDNERYFIEYFLRDAYEFYGYDFQYYDGAPVDEAKLKELVNGFERIDYYMRKTWIKVYEGANVKVDGEDIGGIIESAVKKSMLDKQMERFAQNRLRNARILMRGLRFINRKGQPLRMMPLLQLDPALLENPIYH